MWPADANGAEGVAAMVLVPTPARSATLLPPVVSRLLRRVDRRLRAAAVLRGLGTIGLVAGLGVALGMAAELAWVLPPAVRWGNWSAWLLVLGWLAARRVVAPLVRKSDSLELAALAERGEPSLEERLTATVGLLGDSGRLNGSPALVMALADRASAYAGLVDAARLVSLRGGMSRLAWGGLVLALVAAPSVVRPDPFRTLAYRFLAPWADLERVDRFVLSVVPGDGKAAIGADFLVSARVAPRFGRLAPPTRAWLEWTEVGSKGATRRVAMPEAKPSNPHPSSPDRVFAVSLPRLSGSLAYRVLCGTAASRMFRVEAVAAPSVVAVEARVEPPAYTGLSAFQTRDSRRIEAWEGSRVTLDVLASRPVTAFEVEWPRAAKRVAAAPTPGTGQLRASVPLLAEVSGPYAIALRDEHGLIGRSDGDSLPSSPRRLVVRADAPPQLEVRGPAAAAESAPDDTLRLAVAARDDVAVASVELHYSIRRAGSEATRTHEGAGESQLAATVNGLGTREARGEVALALGSLGLRPGDTLSYRIRVADNRPAPRGPNVVWSSAGSLSIVAAAEPLLVQQARADRLAFQGKLDAIRSANAENRKETEQLRYAADAVQRGNGQWDRDRQQALGQREAEARRVGDRLQLLARELAADPRLQLLARPTRRIAEVEAEASRAKLDQARGEHDPTRRLNDLRQADAQLAAVADRLDDLQRRFDALARGEADRQQLRSLAEREEALAQQVADSASEPEHEHEPDQGQLDRIRAEQADVRNDLDSLLKQSPTLAPRGPLDAAREAMRQAAHRLDQAGSASRDQQAQASQAARQALSQAAQHLSAAATQGQGQGQGQGEGQAQGQEEKEPGEAESELATRAGSNPRDPQGATAAPGAMDLSEIQALVRSKTGRAWGELPGHLRSELLQMSQRRYRDDYSRLIQLYFQEIATGDSTRP